MLKKEIILTVRCIIFPKHMKAEYGHLRSIMVFIEVRLQRLQAGHSPIGTAWAYPPEAQALGKAFDEVHLIACRWALEVTEIMLLSFEGSNEPLHLPGDTI